MKNLIKIMFRGDGKNEFYYHDLTRVREIIRSSNARHYTICLHLIMNFKKKWEMLGHNEEELCRDYHVLWDLLGYKLDEDDK